MRVIIKDKNTIQFRKVLECDFVLLCTVQIDDEASKSGQYWLTVGHALPALAAVRQHGEIATSSFPFDASRPASDNDIFSAGWWQSLETMREIGVLSDPAKWKAGVLSHIEQSLAESARILCPR